jgi:hypothetical protein
MGHLRRVSLRWRDDDDDDDDAVADASRKVLSLAEYPDGRKLGTPVFRSCLVFNLACDSVHVGKAMHYYDTKAINV